LPDCVEASAIDQVLTARVVGVKAFVSPAVLERHDLPAAHRFIRRDHDPEALHRIIHVIAQVQILRDRPQQKPLLPLAEIVMAGLVGGVDALIRLMGSSPGIYR
jgi:hypothetical protein